MLQSMDNPPEQFALTTSRHFLQWLNTTGGGIAFSTYQAGKLFLLGLKPDGKLSVFERTFPRCMGIGVAADGRSLLLATHYQIFRFDDALKGQGKTPDGHDALYVPHQAWITGDLDVHDIAWDRAGAPIFVNTLFSCLATVAPGASFRPVWRPTFVSKLAPEDRCHLNGLAVEAGEAAYVTAVARSDVADGWRDKRASGGMAIDVRSGAIVLEGLSMPHSPRLHGGRLWLLNSGAGEFGYADLKSGRFEPVCFCPGYARGLAFAGHHAVIGLSLARENRTFQGLPLDAALAAKGADPRCGLLIVDTRTGDITDWVRMEGAVRELYDVAALPGISRPSAIGFKTEEIQRVITIGD